MSDNVLVQVGKRIRELRKLRSLSQEALAEKCGFTFSYIGGIERAERNVSLINLSKIAEALNVGVHQLFIYSYELEQLSEEEESVKEIIELIMAHDSSAISTVTNVIKEILKNYPRK